MPLWKGDIWSWAFSDDTERGCNLGEKSLRQRKLQVQPWDRNGLDVFEDQNEGRVEIRNTAPDKVGEIDGLHHAGPCISL